MPYFILLSAVYGARRPIYFQITPSWGEKICYTQTLAALPTTYCVEALNEEKREKSKNDKYAEQTTAYIDDSSIW